MLWCNDVTLPQRRNIALGTFSSKLKVFRETKEDFPEYDFILEDGKGLFKYDFMVRYIGTGLEDAILISEPMYYMNKKYIMFYYSKAYSTGGVKSSTVIMKKEKENWVIVRVIGDNVY